MRWVHAIVAGSVALVLVPFFGCSDDPTLAQLAQGCSINSDCTDPLACAFGRCHTQCQATRDCPAGLLCVAAGPTTKVCQLPEEAKCTATTKCPFGLVCSNATCRNACQTNDECIPGQECARGACFDRLVEADGGPLPTFDDAGTTTDASMTADTGPIFTGMGPLGFSTSNFDPNLVVTVTDGGITNLPSRTISAQCDARCLPPPTTIEMKDGIHADLYALQDLVVEQSATLSFTDESITNPRPIIIAVAGTADIQGIIRVAAIDRYPGPGGFGLTNPGPGKGGSSTNNGGAGGGSYCGIGGKGIGVGAKQSANDTMTYGTPEIVPLVGGSAGSINNGDVSGNGAGAGGGVIQISAKGSIFVHAFAVISAGGGGGLGGGSAGGSGGAILLEAPTITIEGAVVANGGAGSGGPPAANGTLNATPAIGSTQYGIGGSGSAGTSIVGGDGTPQAVDTTASGGGGAGRIRINTASGSAMITGIVSPALSTPCATQGTIKP